MSMIQIFRNLHCVRSGKNERSKVRNRRHSYFVLSASLGLILMLGCGGNALAIDMRDLEVTIRVLENERDNPEEIANTIELPPELRQDMDQHRSDNDRNADADSTERSDDEVKEEYEQASDDRDDVKESYEDAREDHDDAKDDHDDAVEERDDAKEGIDDGREDEDDIDDIRDGHDEYDSDDHM